LSEKVIEDGLVMLHPIRWKILKTLEEKNVPMHIDAIANAISEDRRLVSFHLSTLEEKGFLESEFKLIENPKSKGKAGRFYKLTSKVEETRPKLIEILES